ncbi:putative peptidase M28 family protein [Lyophyllum shimeji]|uniref:Peptide hydrolase n=1 Tax=Lyophyllum shimeji TaxID=47721 RepID=A0A9P3UKP3_LYOSH|nr:putative peptidase M28 family protein [Lyophyllum shimeji]
MNFISFLLFSALYTCLASRLGDRTLPELSASGITTLITTPDPIKNVDPSNPASHLSKILIPRVSDTENNTIVRDYIVSTLKALQWHVEIDEFTDKTPIGTKRFRNIIATKDPTASRRVILAAHYDSKYSATYPDDQFVGATDSAAPCAMMLDVAEALNPLLDERKKRLDEGLEDDEDVADTTLQLVFFDGEEAFVVWTATDSIYGARHLADKWASTYLSPHGKRRLMGTQSTELTGIEHLILLDLLGAPQPSLRSYFLDTAWLFDALVSVERRLGESGAFAYGEEQGMAPEKWTTYFQPRTELKINMGYIGDDHVPFLERGVPVLHLIADPFPPVWHTLKDDATALDIPTMRRWNLMLRVLMSEYLHLRPEDAQPHSAVRRDASEL